jgi:hypothetical protein
MSRQTGAGALGTSDAMRWMILAPLVFSACTASPAARQRQAAALCTSNNVAVVTNQSTLQVDVFAQVDVFGQQGGTERRLGAVRPRASRTFRLPPRTVVIARFAGSDERHEAPDETLVQIRYYCR